MKKATDAIMELCSSAETSCLWFHIEANMEGIFSQLVNGVVVDIKVEELFKF